MALLLLHDESVIVSKVEVHARLFGFKGAPRFLVFLPLGLLSFFSFFRREGRGAPLRCLSCGKSVSETLEAIPESSSEVDSLYDTFRRPRSFVVCGPLLGGVRAVDGYCRDCLVEIRSLS